uniref:Uncharacterized protein n=1 Tax=Anguilla anguilla TaxID=7936 RepID=A0A0E9XS65_ANGAN
MESPVKSAFVDKKKTLQSIFNSSIEYIFYSTVPLEVCLKTLSPPML